MGSRSRLAKMAGIAATVMGLVVSGVYITGAEDPAGRSGDRAGSSPQHAAVDKAAVAEELARMPLSFEPNVGQGGDGAAFVARGLDYGLALSPTEATMSAGPSVVKMRLVGANAAAAMSGGDELEGRINYFVGDDPQAWRTDVATYAQVRSTGVWAGVDLVWHAGKAGELEYDFIVAPGTSPKAIAVGFDGAKSLRLDGGDLLVATDGGELRQHAPVLYQDLGGRRKPVPGSFVLDNNTVRFSVGAYDTTQPLVIDPTLEWSTYLGGATAPFADDEGNDIAVDSKGAAYVTGKACSASFPKTTYAYDKTLGGTCDAFVTKFKPVQGTGVGTGLKYSTYLGGSGPDFGNSIAVDSAFNAYVTGRGSSGFPTTPGAYQQNGGPFLTKLNPGGKALLYSTRMPGDPNSITLALGPAMEATPAIPTVYLASANAGPAPTANAFQASCHLIEGACHDFWIARFNPVSSGVGDVVYATYLGGTEREGQYVQTSLAVDSSGRAIIGGMSESPDFPITDGAFDDTPTVGQASPGVDGVLAMLDPALASDGSGVPSPSNQQLVWSTYLYATPHGVATGPGGTVYFTGGSFEGDEVFPGTPGAYDSGEDCVGSSVGFACAGVVAKFDPSLPGDGSGVPSATNPQLVYSTHIRGTELVDVAVDAEGRAWVSGYTYSSTAPTKNPYQATCGCFYNANRPDGYVVGIDPGGNGAADLLFATFLGGRNTDWFFGIALGAPGTVYVTGSSNSSKNSHGNGKADRYPVTPNAFQTGNPGGRSLADENCNDTHGGCYEAVVSKITGL